MRVSQACFRLDPLPRRWYTYDKHERYPMQKNMVKRFWLFVVFAGGLAIAFSIALLLTSSANLIALAGILCTFVVAMGGIVTREMNARQEHQLAKAKLEADMFQKHKLDVVRKLHTRFMDMVTYVLKFSFVADEEGESTEKLIALYQKTNNAISIYFQQLITAEHFLDGGEEAKRLAYEVSTCCDEYVGLIRKKTEQEEFDKSEIEKSVEHRSFVVSSRALAAYFAEILNPPECQRHIDVEKIRKKIEVKIANGT
jgi:hypothetical protein